MITKSNEEYLKTMYILKVSGKEVRVTDIANIMNISKPSVNKAVKSLKENKLINYEIYGKIELTEKGEDLARKILEAYDIVYVFLKDVLELEAQKAEEEAENLKANMSDETLNALAKYVHKTLKLNDLNCNYDIAQERCRSCKRRKDINDEKRTIKNK